MKIADFNLFDEATEESLIELTRRFNQTASAYPRDQTVHGVFAQRARETPGCVAVEDRTRSITYSELDHASGRLADVLISQNLTAEGFVAVLLNDTPSLVTALLGTLKAGGAYCPIDPDTPYDRVRHVLTDTDASILITDSDPALADQPARDCPSLKTVIRELGWATETIGRPGEELTIPERAGPQHLAYVMYTSGTSGRPKGVLIEHRSILRLVLGSSFVPLDRSTRVLMTGAVAFDASTLEIWGPLLNGGTLVRPDKLAIVDPAEVKRLIGAHAITTMWLTASLFNHIVETDVSAVGGLRDLLVGGERLSPRHVERVMRTHPALRLVNGYGPTENTTFTTCHPIERVYDDDVPLGRPIANTEVLVLDAAGRFAPPGVPGEICAAGDGLARGYLRDPALTAERFRPHPTAPGRRIYATRDRGRWTDDGLLEYLGRLDTQFKIRGHRIEPAEIEARLRECEEVRDALVIPVDGEGGERCLAAYVIGTTIDPAALRARLKTLVPDYMVPRCVVPIERFPLTANGKIDVKALPPPDPRGSVSAAEPPPFANEVEAALANVWQEVLGIDRVGPFDNFFDVGGHSLNVTRIVALTHQKLGVAPPLALLFRCQTIRELAAALVDAARYGVSLADDAMVLLGGSAGAPAVFALPPGTGDVLSYMPLAARWPDYRIFAFNFIEAPTRIADYADLIERTEPAGAHVLLGYSAGGNLAFHVAAELERRGLVVAKVVMIDSGRVLSPYPFVADKVREATDVFLSHPTIQPYCESPLLREKVAQKIAACYRFLSETTDSHVIDADIDLVVSRDCAMDSYYDGRHIASMDAWASATRGRFTVHRGLGTHNEMLFEPAVDPNAAMLKDILDRVGRGGATNLE